MPRTKSETPQLNEGDNWSFKTKHGAVKYLSRGLSGCCGIGVVFNVIFGRLSDDHSVFYKEFENHLKTIEDDILNRGAIMMSDAVGGEEDREYRGIPCIYSMCETLDWDKSEPVYNPRSGNNVVTFIMERNVYGLANEYPLED